MVAGFFLLIFGHGTKKSTLENRGWNRVDTDFDCDIFCGSHRIDRFAAYRIENHQTMV